MSEDSNKYLVKRSSCNQDLALAEIKKLLAEQQLGVLVTNHGETPHASIVGFANSEDAREIYFVTPRNSRKFTNLKSQPQVALLIDNRSNLPSDFHLASAVTVNGNAAETGAEHRQKAIRIFSDRHPHLSEFAASSDCAVCRISIECYRLVRKFQQVTEIVL